MKTKTDKIVKKDKGGKHLVYNQKHSFPKFKDISDIKEVSLDSMHKKLSECHKKFTKLKDVNSHIKANEYLKGKEIFSMKCITFTKKNIKKKKMV